MKKIFPGIIFVFFISLAFCSEDEKYSFISSLVKEENIGKSILYHTDRELSFTIPSIGYIKYASSFNERMKYVGKEGRFYIIESTLTEMKTENSIANIEIMDYYWEAMDGVPCYIYINSDGNVDHIETIKEEHEYLLEAFEGAHMGMFEKNYLYPLGFKAVDKKIGESWNEGIDSSKFYMTMDSPPSFAWIKELNILKKVKEKRDRKIAYVEESETLSINIILKIKYLDEERFIKGRANGAADGMWKWDVESGCFLSLRVVSKLQGDFEMDDETFFTKLSRTELHKLLE